MTIDPDILAAYADGELDAAETARVEAAIAADPALAEQVAAHRALRAQLSAHFAPIMDQPVPEHLRALLGPKDDAETPAPRDNVVDLAAVRQSRAEPVTRRLAFPRLVMGGALAASLAVGLLLGGQIRPNGPIASRDGQVVASGALDKALTSSLAVSPDTGAPRMLLSFQTTDGHYCRAFEDGANAGIACRSGDAWAIRQLRSGERTTATAGGYRQAGSSAAGIMAAAQDMAAGPALDAVAERRARDAGWKK